MQLAIDPAGQYSPFFYGELKRYAYGHPQHGALTYTTSMQQILTTTGALYLSTLTPLDDDTVATFFALAQTAGPDARCVTPWPHPALRAH